MCGIAGLFLKNPTLEPQLGALMTNMLNVLTERGPDSAGFAIYGASMPGRIKFTVRVKPGFDVLSLLAKLEARKRAAAAADRAEREKVRRQKRGRSKAAKRRILADKAHNSARKAQRRPGKFD